MFNMNIPGFMNFNFNGGNFVIGGSSPVFLIGNLIYLLIRQVVQWWNSRPSTTNNNNTGNANINNSANNNTSESRHGIPPVQAPQETSPFNSSDINAIIVIVLILFVYMILY